MTNDAQRFIDCLNDARQLLNDYSPTGFANKNDKTSDPHLESFNLDLFEEWSKLGESETVKKTKIRIIQHLSCTGGTLISKCLAAMPNVTLLNEANPFCRLPFIGTFKFRPTDLTYLALRGGIPQSEELVEKIFKADIAVISEHVKQLGKYLVIREHSHSDFLVGEKPNELSTIIKLLKNDYTVLSVITIRHPVDSYLSLLNSGWVHYSPSSFDEYCYRYIQFIECNENVALFKYEDFVDNPTTVAKDLCKALKLPFNKDFQDIFDLSTLSGDSGRSSSAIAKRERRKFDESFKKELSESEKYFTLCKKLDYESSIN